MDWYYTVGGEQRGPVGEEEFQRLVQQGVVTAETLVWREGMANWQPQGGATGAGSGVPPVISSPAAGGGVVCAGCGRTFARGEVIPLGGGLFCAACKPLAVQRLREGAGTNTAAEEMRNEHLKHEASVKSVGILYYLGGGALLLGGVITMVAGAGSAGVRGGLTGAFLVLLGVGQLWVGTGLRRLRKWARIPTGILSGLGLLGFPIGTIINAYILYLIFSQKGQTVFSDEYQAVIEQTPHIKYRTSFLIWVLLGLVLLVLAFALAGVFMGRK